MEDNQLITTQEDCLSFFHNWLLESGRSDEMDTIEYLGTESREQDPLAQDIAHVLRTHIQIYKVTDTRNVELHPHVEQDEFSTHRSEPAAPTEAELVRATNEAFLEGNQLGITPDDIPPAA